jgi:soluble lytic murein transglycosylase-like protein
VSAEFGLVLTLWLSALLAAHPLFEEEIQAAISDAASVFVVPPELVRAVIRQESAFNPRALSACGAIGLMQVMPSNALALGLADERHLWSPRLNVLAGVRLLAALLKHYDGDVVSALVAYNSGAKSRTAPVPNNGETPEYVVRVLSFWRDYRRHYGPASNAH